MTPALTVVVVNWHEVAATARCVESIRAQGGVVGGIEVVIVDNASTPATRAALRGLDARVVTSRRNSGFAGGANLGIVAARGDVIAVVNNDCVLDEGWARRGLRVLEDPDVGLVGGADLLWDDLHPVGRLDGPRVTAPVVDPAGGYCTASSDAPPRGDVLALNGSNLMAPADVLRRLRGFETRFFAYYEDTDLSARVWAIGRRVVFAPDMVVWHRRNLTSDRIPFRKVYLAHRNHMRLVARHFPDDEWRSAVRRAALHGLAVGVRGADDGIPLARSERRARAAAGAWGLAGFLRLGSERRRVAAAGEHYRDFVGHAARDRAGRA